ncbi:MAG: hypothetical protein ASARMPREDX12_005405 [Alectoria sarmentosa]|nr:MAG: hypothetical protein ASARMPREDX12_005405 [Alectoria sarmentosa]
MKGDITILRPTFDAMSSTLFAGPPLANVTHVKASLERSAMAMFAVAQTYWIELASILVLCLLLCLGFLRTSISRRKRASNTECSADIQRRLFEDSAGHLSGCAESKHHLVTGIRDQSPHVQDIGMFTREWEGFSLPRDTLLAMYENISVTEMGTTEVSEKDTAELLFDPLLAPGAVPFVLLADFLMLLVTTECTAPLAADAVSVFIFVSANNGYEETMALRARKVLVGCTCERMGATTLVRPPPEPMGVNGSNKLVRKKVSTSVEYTDTNAERTLYIKIQRTLGDGLLGFKASVDPASSTPSEDEYERECWDVCPITALIATSKTYISVLVDGNTLKFDDNYIDGPYRAGCRAADTLRTLITEVLSSSGIQMGQNIEQLIRVYANCEDLIPSKLDGKQMEIAKDLLIHFRRGFNTRQPLSVFEDTSMSGPSGAGDTLLKQLKDSSCIQIIVAKPYGSTTSSDTIPVRGYTITRYARGPQAY